MGVKVTNNAFGTISAGINTSATTIVLDSGQGARFPALGSGDFFFGTLIDTSNNLEIVKVTARSSDSMTVTRAQDSTSARSFAIGDRFELRPTAALFNQLVTDISNASVAGISSSADATAITIDSSENVGIGKTSPGTRLHVEAGNGEILTVSSSAGSDLKLHIDGNEISFRADADNNESDSVITFDIDGAEHFRIDPQGISMPTQPIAEAYYSAASQDGAYNATNRNNVVCKPGATHINTGNMYSTSTGRFTVAEGGRYMAMVGGSQYNNGVTGYWYVFIRKNGSIQKYLYNSLTGASWETLVGFTTFTMAAGDYIDFYNMHDSNTGQRGGWDINNYTKFLVYKIT